MPDPPPPLPTERKKQIIAAKNLLFGASHFLILSLPEGWGVVRSYLEPDVHSTVSHGGMIWVEAGQTDQIVFNRSRKVAVDFMLQIKMGKHENLDLKRVEISSRGTGVIGGHPGSYVLGGMKQGFPFKKSYRTLRLFFYCPELDHTLFLHFTGTCEDSVLKELLDSLPYLECH